MALKTKSRRTLIVVLSIVCVVLAVGVGVGVYALTLANNFNNNTNKITDAFPEDEFRPDASPDGAQNILLLGSDSRIEHQSSKLDTVPDQRSDSIMLVHVPAGGGAVYITSFMRDSWVDIPGYGKNKINAALSFGGVKLTVQTIENLTGVRVDHVAMVDFAGFKAVTTALGGVTIDNPIEFTSSNGTAEHFPQGEITLNGTEALSFVRERYKFIDGDYQRARNQQLFIKGMLTKVMSKETLTNPVKINDLVSSIAPYMTVDSEFTAAYIASLAPLVASMSANDVQFMTAPTTGTGTSPDGQSIVVLDEAKMAELATAMQTDGLAAYFAAHKNVTPGSEEDTPSTTSTPDATTTPTP